MSRSKAGGASHNLEVTPAAPPWLHCCEPHVRREGARQDLIAPYGLGPGSLACCGLPNGVDFASPGFPVRRMGRAPSFQPAFLRKDDGLRNCS